MTLLALDPGTFKTAWLVLEDGKIRSHGIDYNAEVLSMLAGNLFKPSPDFIVCEMIAAYGMAVGKEVFETCVYIGRFCQAARRPFHRSFRKDIKLHLCGTMRAKDANIRQALIDRLGPQGTKKEQGPTYGIKSHEWAALAVAIHAFDTMQ
jgi:hypothetical protein